MRPEAYVDEEAAAELARLRKVRAGFLPQVEVRAHERRGTRGVRSHTRHRIRVFYRRPEDWTGTRVDYDEAWADAAVSRLIGEGMLDVRTEDLGPYDLKQVKVFDGGVLVEQE